MVHIHFWLLLLLDGFQLRFDSLESLHLVGVALRLNLTLSVCFVDGCRGSSLLKRILPNGLSVELSLLNAHGCSDMILGITASAQLEDHGHLHVSVLHTVDGIT